MYKVNALGPLLNKKIVGLISLSNVDLIDRPFNESSNTIGQFFDVAEACMIRTQFAGNPMRAAAPDADLIVQLGAAQATVNDLVAPFRFRMDANGILDQRVPVLGYAVKISYTQNTVAQPFSLNIFNYASEGADTPAPVAPVIYTDLNRIITVTPTGGGNTVSEFVILNVSPAFLASYNGTDREYPTPSAQSTTILSPYMMAGNDDAYNLSAGSICTSALVFSGQANVNQVLTVTPILNTLQGIEVLADLIAAKISK